MESKFAKQAHVAVTARSSFLFVCCFIGSYYHQLTTTRKRQNRKEEDSRFVTEQVIFSANDRSHYNGPNPADSNFFRSSILAYVHYRPNGTISPVVIDSQGVNSHNASNGQSVQAEHFLRLLDDYDDGPSLAAAATTASIATARKRSRKIWLGEDEVYVTPFGAKGNSLAVSLFVDICNEGFPCQPALKHPPPPTFTPPRARAAVLNQVKITQCKWKVVELCSFGR